MKLDIGISIAVAAGAAALAAFANVRTVEIEPGEN